MAGWIDARADKLRILQILLHSTLINFFCLLVLIAPAQCLRTLKLSPLTGGVQGREGVYFGSWLIYSMKFSSGTLCAGGVSLMSFAKINRIVKSPLPKGVIVILDCDT